MGAGSEDFENRVHTEAPGHYKYCLKYQILKTEKKKPPENMYVETSKI